MKEKIPKALFLLFTVVIIIVAVVMVKKQEENKTPPIIDYAEQKKYSTEIRIGISALDTFDPILSNNKNVQDVCKLIYEPLLTVDENFKIKGVLAEEWAKTAENSYLIKLKQGIKWYDGNEFTSKDVEFTINKIKQETNNSIYKSNVENIVQVTIIDNYTIKLDLQENEAFFEYNLIFPIEQAIDYSVETKVNASGTGIYKISQINGNEIQLTRNPYKENIEGVQIKTIIVRNYPTMGELYNDFKIGNIDIINTDNINYSNYIGTLGYTEKNFYGRNFNFLSFNTKNIALYNIEVRRAISYAIDKNLILSNIYNNKYYIANYPLDYGNWLYSNETTSSGYNPEQSKQILEDNGWQYKNNTWQKNINNKLVQLKFNLLVNSKDELRLQVAENIKQQLENVGIKINIMKASDITSYLENKNYDIALIEMSMSISPDLSTFFGINNLANYENQEAITIIEELKEITDENLLKERYNKLLEIYKTDLPYLSLYFSNSTLIYNSKMIGTIIPTWYNLFYNIENWRIEV